MSKKNEPIPHPKREQGGPQPTLIGPEFKIKGGYQPPTGKLSPTKPPTNPPNKGSSGKK